MENETFGRFLYQLRTSVTPKKMSQEQVGKIIGTTRQYIDAIEKQKINTSPPRFEQCVKLAKELTQDESIRARFLWSAFKERIRNNWDYYEYLHKEEGERPKIGEYDNPEINRRPNTKKFKCRFELQWFSRTPITLTETAQITVDQTITETLNNSKFNLEGLKVSEAQISFIITAPTPELIEELITGLKDVTTRNIKNNCTDMVIQSPSVWEDGYLVRTLEYPLESYIPTHTTSQSVNA